MLRKSSTIATSSSGRPPCSSTGRAASCAIAACACAAKAWMCGRSACRTAASARVIAPNGGDHLDCEECGMCIDICPVGALTSGSISLQDAPVGDEPRRHRLHPLRRRLQDHTRRARVDDGMEIVRGDNRDKSGINGDFLCIKGRYAFRLRRITGAPARSRWCATRWQARRRRHGKRRFAADAAKLKEIRDTRWRRCDRRDRFEPHHQRRELPAAEVRAHGAGHQQH